MAITLADFTKIWASTSPLTPYSFSESNYKEGWNFIGGTPPARQMWDFLQKRNDEKAQWLYNNKLSLSGGTMTGAIKGNPITLTAYDGNESANLVLDSSGSATWNGKEVERINASGNKYIRYENGIQICWGNGSPSSGVISVTFPLPFIDNYYDCFGCALPGGAGTGAGRVVTCSANNKSPTSIALTVLDIDGSLAGTGVDWFAIGYWK